MKSIFRVAVAVVAIVPFAAGQLIYSNGPTVTHPGAGAGGGDASALEAWSTIFGFGHSVATGIRVADDFTVPCGQTWNITSIDFWAYQTNSGTTSTINNVNYKIWNGPPNSGGTVIHDFSAASQLTSTTFSNIYRVVNTTLTNAQRPLMKNTAAGNGISLPAGTYWLDWQTGGTLASGPWVPPITILGQQITGNSIQFQAATGWAANVSGPAFQGLPFDINGTITTSNCFALNITQAGGPGTPVTLANTGGTPGNTAFNVITLYGGAYPAGWFFGVDIPLTELGGLAGGGPPFVVTLDAMGGFTTGPIPVSLPFPIPIYYVGLEISGATLIVADAAKTITLS